MALTKVKICGITNPAALHAAAEAGADWVGFNFFPPSPRFVTPARAAAISATVAGGPLRVGLFVDPNDTEIEAALAALDLDILQVYAGPERAAALATSFARPVWRSVAVAATADLPQAEPGVTAFLLEAKPPPGAPLPGGSARPLDWSLLRGWHAPAPWLLAGGLTPDNVAQALALSGAPAVDVSSGVERQRGVKDADLIRDFIAAARRAG